MIQELMIWRVDVSDDHLPHETASTKDLGTSVRCGQEKNYLHLDTTTGLSTASEARFD